MSKKVQILGQISGARDGKPWPAPGEWLTVSDDEAETLIRNGLATDKASKDDALLDSEPHLSGAGSNEEKRVLQYPAPHADEPAAYHVPELPGERKAAEAGQKHVDEAQKAAGVQRVEVQATEPKPALDGKDLKK